jgi:hypothetical protein
MSLRFVRPDPVRKSPNRMPAHPASPNVTVLVGIIGTIPNRLLEAAQMFHPKLWISQSGSKHYGQGFRDSHHKTLARPAQRRLQVRWASNFSELRYGKVRGISLLRTDLLTNHATYGGNWLDRNLLLVGFPLAQDLVEYHASSCIFIRYHNISCSARSLAEAKSKLPRSLGGSLRRNLHVNFPEQPYCEVAWIGLRLLGLLAPRVCLGTQP